MAKDLPKDTYEAMVKYHPFTHYTDHKEKKEDGTEVVHQVPLVGQWTEYPVNHARRIKRIWNRTKSFEAINEYFHQYNLKLNFHTQ